MIQQTIDALNAYIDQSVMLFDDMEQTTLVQCLQAEIANDGSVPMLNADRQQKNGKYIYVFSDKKFNNYSQEEEYAMSMLWCLCNYCFMHGIKLSTAAALYLLVFIDYPSKCALFAFVIDHLCTKRDIDKRITMEQLMRLFPNGMPNKEFCRGFWQIRDDNES